MKPAYIYDNGRPGGMRVLSAALCLMFLLLAAGTASALQPTHEDTLYNPEGCAGCHTGKGSVAGQLLRADREKMCFWCHTYKEKGQKRKSSIDMESLFEKESRHKVDELSMWHTSYEELPAKSPSQVRHVACGDCHRAHISTTDKPTKGTKGYQPGKFRSQGMGVPTGAKMNEPLGQYQLCYLCHADSANLPADKRNIAAELNPDNASFHPVEAVGKNLSVPSLYGSMTASSRIDCDDCHGNSNPSGPKGPHASDYAPLLKSNYRTTDGPETRDAYDLCYGCHNRTSVLKDDSFKRHKQHVVTSQYACHNCHASHGSEQYTSTINFDTTTVSASSISGGPYYLPAAGGMPKCYLSCHGTDHNISKVGEKEWPW